MFSLVKWLDGTLTPKSLKKSTWSCKWNLFITGAVIEACMQLKVININECNTIHIFNLKIS